MRLTDNPLEGIDDTLCRLLAIPRAAQVVDTLIQDDPLHALLSEQVTLIAVHGSRAQAATQHVIATDTHIQHTHLTGLFVGQQSA